MAFRAGHSASHTVQTRAKRSRNTHVPPHATRLHKVSSVSAAGREQRLGVSPASFPFSSAQTKKAACSHETLVGNTKFGRSFLSRKHVTNMRNTPKPPTCSQCGARGSNTGKNTRRSSEVQKKKGLQHVFHVPCADQVETSMCRIRHESR